MRKATLVLATSVAFLLFGVSTSYAGTKKSVQIPSASSVASGSGAAVRNGNSLSVPGALQGEFIPGDSGLKGTPFKVLPTIDFSIPRTLTQAKNLLKAGGVAGLVGSVAFAALLDSVDAVIEEGGTVTKTSLIPTTTLSMYWCMNQNISNCNKNSSSYLQKHYATPTSAIFDYLSQSNLGLCSYSTVTSTSTHNHYAVIYSNATKGCSYGMTSNIHMYRHGSCPAGSTYSEDQKQCLVPNGQVPLEESDYLQMDVFANQQNAEWLKGLLKDTCEGSLSPGACFEQMKDMSALSGPPVVSGPSLITTKVTPSGTTTTETKTDYKITYGDNFFIWAPSKTTTTINPDGTTEVETEEETAEEEPTEEEPNIAIEDAYAPVVEKYNDIAGGVGDLEGNMSFINYGPWYSFGGNCTPITLNLPVMGVYTIDHCPYVINWIRPTLGFLFAVWTWLHCFSLWRETVQNARPI